MPGNGELNIKVGADVGQAVTSVGQLSNSVGTLTNYLKQLNEQRLTITDLNQLKNVNSQIEGVTANINRLSNVGKEGFDNVGNAVEGSTGKVKDFATELAGVAGVAVTVEKVFEFFKDSIAEFQHAQQEATKLQNILSNIGRLDIFEDLKTQAEKLAKSFGTLKSEDVTGVFDQLITYGKLTKNQIDELLPVIINFAAKTGQDLSSSTSLIEKALEGNGRALKQFGIDMTDGATTAERFGIIMTELKPRVEGAAAAFGETTAGQIKKTKIEIDELKKSIGEDLDPVVKGFYQGISGLLAGLTNTFNVVQVGFQGIVTTAKEAAAVLSGNFGDLAGIIAQDNAMKERNKSAHELNEINATAKVFTDAENRASLDAYDKALKAGKSETDARKVQIGLLQQQTAQQEALQKVSLKAYSDLAAAGKANTAEGHAAAVQAETDNTIVANSYKLIAAAKDTRVLGFGGGKTNTGEDAKKALDDQIALLEQIKKVRDELAKPDNRPISQKQASAVTIDDNGNEKQSQSGKDAIALIQANLQKAILTANEGVKEALIAGHAEQAEQIKANLEDLKNLTAQEIDKIKFPDLKAHTSAQLEIDKVTLAGLNGDDLQKTIEEGTKKFEELFKDKPIQIKIPANFSLSVEDDGFSQEDSKKIASQLQKDFASHSGVGADGIIPIIPSLRIQWDKALLQESNIDKLVNQVETIVKNVKVQLLSSIGDLAGDLLSGQANPIGTFLKGIGEILGEGLKSFGKAILEAAVTMSALKKAITFLGTNPAIGIPVAIAAIAAGTIIENDLKKQSAHAFATGGIVTGPTLGLVGEAGPEVIFPLDRLNRFVKGMNNGGQSNVVVTGRLRGQDIYISSNRAVKNNKLYQ